MIEFDVRKLTNIQAAATALLSNWVVTQNNLINDNGVCLTNVHPAFEKVLVSIFSRHNWLEIRGNARKNDTDRFYVHTPMADNASDLLMLNGSVVAKLPRYNAQDETIKLHASIVVLLDVLNSLT